MRGKLMQRWLPWPRPWVQFGLFARFFDVNLACECRIRGCHKNQWCLWSHWIGWTSGTGTFFGVCVVCQIVLCNIQSHDFTLLKPSWITNFATIMKIRRSIEGSKKSNDSKGPPKKTHNNSRWFSLKFLQERVGRLHLWQWTQRATFLGTNTRMEMWGTFLVRSNRKRTKETWSFWRK